MYYIGLDLGGTKLAGGLVNDENKIVQKYAVPTNVKGGGEAIVRDMDLVTRELIKREGITLDEVAWVGIGTPGTVDVQNGVLLYANNLHVENLVMAPMLSELLGGKKVYIDNDANAALIGEIYAGCAKGYRDAMIITLGTGIGFAALVDGRMLQGAAHGGGEAGHMTIEMGGRLCTCGKRGCFETYCNAGGLVQTAQEFLDEDRDSLMWEMCDNDVFKMNTRIPFRAMEQGDATATEVVHLYADQLGIGIANLVNIFQPEIVIIGGGISPESKYLIPRIKKVVSQEGYSSFSAERTVFEKATLGNDAGIIGAALLGKMYH